jgi:hypothetical protein
MIALVRALKVRNHQRIVMLKAEGTLNYKAVVATESDSDCTVTGQVVKVWYYHISCTEQNL